MSGGLYPRDWTQHPPALAPDYKTSRQRAPLLPLVDLDAGQPDPGMPVFAAGDLAPGDSDLLTNFAAPGQSALGARLLMHGRVLDENARPVPGALIEIWQANAAGRYRHQADHYRAPLDPNFSGGGRCISDRAGRYRFTTVKPGAYPWPNGANSWRPAHIHLSLCGPSFGQRLITQLYFQGDPLIDLCPIAQSVPCAAARARLIARLDMEAAVPFDMLAYRFDIVLRGRRQTLFENRPDGG